LVFNFVFLIAKKGKKKGQTLNLTEFLGGYGSSGSGATTTVTVKSTWADEMDEAEMDDRDQRKVFIIDFDKPNLGRPLMVPVVIYDSLGIPSLPATSGTNYEMVPLSPGRRILVECRYL
jgi:hypothetical protein